MKRILSLLLLLLTIPAVAQFVPAQNNYGNYNIYGGQWTKGKIYFDRFKHIVNPNDTIFVFVKSDGELDTVNLSVIKTVVGGATASKWAYNGSTLHPLDTSKNVAIGTNDALGYGLYNSGTFKNKYGLADFKVGDTLFGFLSRNITAHYYKSSTNWNYYQSLNDGSSNDPFIVSLIKNTPGPGGDSTANFSLDEQRIHAFVDNNSYEKCWWMTPKDFYIGNTWIDGYGQQKFFRIDSIGQIQFNNEYKFPLSDGTAGQALVTDGSGNISFSDITVPSYWDSTGTGLIYLKTTANKLAIGASSLAGTEKVRVYNGSVLFDGTTGATPVSGAGTRFVWIPAKAALRAGIIDGTQWDAANIGTNSTALNENCKASGYAALSAGYGNNATNTAGVALNYGTNATGTYALSTGVSTYATGSASFSANNATEANGNFSSAFNLATNSKSYAQTTIGRYNIPTGDGTSWVSTDPLFQIGNGTGTGANSNDAFRINKDGSGWLGDATPAGNALFAWETTGNTITIDSLLTKSGARVLADDATLAAPTGIVGGGTVYVTSATTVIAWAHFNYNSDGTVTLESNSANVVNTDTDNYFCIIDNGSGFAFKNRLGAKYTIKYTLIY